MESKAQAANAVFSLGYYDKGYTPFYALQSEPRLSYCLYVPMDYKTDDDRIYPLVVLVHGTERGAHLYRDGFAEFAEQQKAIVLAPLFPCNLLFVGDQENYKLLRARDFRFDLSLLSMVDEVAARYRVQSDKFLLHGFSGGGHFAHRFLYAHPDRLSAVSIGAPGVVTLCDQTKRYPLGLDGMADYLGGEIKPDLVEHVPVQCVVGSKDTDTWEITVEPGELFWTPGINDTGRTRIDRLRSLATSLETAGCSVQFDLISGVSHDERGLVASVQAFLKNHLP